MHKFSARGNHIGVEVGLALRRFVRELDAFFSPLGSDGGSAFCLLLLINGLSESTRPLLIHLGSGGDSVNGQVECFVGLDNGNDSVDVLENEVEHLSLRLRCWSIQWMAARMDDTIHVQVQVVHIWVVFPYLLLYKNCWINLSIIVIILVQLNFILIMFLVLLLLVL